MLVAFYSYESGTGKDTAADFTKEWCDDLGFSFSRAAFADRMKIVCADALGIPGEDQDKIGFIDKIKLTGSVHYRWRTVNKVTQQSPGTPGREFIIGLAESIRRLDPEFWIRHTATSDADLHAITDLRFQPEADFVKREGGMLVEIRRAEGSYGHRNEDRISCDAVINNNGDLDEFRALVRSCMFGLAHSQILDEIETRP